MNSKHYACIFLALYVLVFGLAFYLIEFVYTPDDEKSKDVVYIELVAPEEEPEPEEKKPIPNATPKPDPNSNTDAKNTLNQNNPAPKNKQTESKGPAKENRTPKPGTLFPGVTGGVAEPVASGNQGEVDSLLSNSGKNAYSLNGSGKDDKNEGQNNPRRLEGDYLPEPDKNRVTQEGTLIVMVVLDSKGNVTSAQTVKSVGITSDQQKEATLEAAKKAKFGKSSISMGKEKIEYYFENGSASVKRVK
jgi:outer membrane biosynthesis protein TonB